MRSPHWFWITLVLPLPFFFQTVSQVGTTPREKPPVTHARVEIPFKLYQDYLIVVKGSAGTFEGLNLLLDTGANVTSVDRGIARKLGLKGQNHKLVLFNQAARVKRVLLPSLQLRAQPAHSLTLRPSITLVGTNDDACHEAITQLQRFIGEFPFVRGHRIYVVCDSAAWQRVLLRLTLGYGVIVNSRAAISDIRLRETWFYATALRKGSDGKPGEYIYAHELGHFVCSCIDEAAAHKAAVQLLNDVHSRSQALHRRR